MDNMQHPIKTQWTSYYRELEKIRQEGICNMWGAAPVLSSRCGITKGLATDILMSWISNYSELANKYGWRK